MVFLAANFQLSMQLKFLAPSPGHLGAPASPWVDFCGGFNHAEICRDAQGGSKDHID